MVEQLADGRPVGVEVEIRRKVVRCGVIESQFASFDHLHHLGRDHGLGDVGDGELVVDRRSLVPSAWPVAPLQVPSATSLWLPFRPHREPRSRRPGTLPPPPRRPGLR